MGKKHHTEREFEKVTKQVRREENTGYRDQSERQVRETGQRDRSERLVKEAGQRGRSGKAG